MSDLATSIGRTTSILVGLTLLGCAFLLWDRSKAATLACAIAGAMTVGFEILYFVLDFVIRGGSFTREQIQAMFALTSIAQSILTYASLGAMAIFLARRRT